MRITFFIPGTGHFVCGSCLRDNALVSALERRGHDVDVIPLYLPLVPDDDAHPTNERVFMGGVNMYLQQKLPLARWLPAFLARRLDSPRLLRWLASKSDMTDAAGHARMLVSTLQGESGRQAGGLEQLIAWMRSVPPPDVLCLSNVMLIGLARRLKEAVDAPMLCTLQGEAPFLDAMPEPYRGQAWSTIADRAKDVDAFVPVSRYYADVCREKLGVDDAALHVVHNGIEIDGLAPAAPDPGGPVIGYLARMCPDKGLHTLIDAFAILKGEPGFEDLRLDVAGVMLGADRSYVGDLRTRLERAGIADAARFRPNIGRAEKVSFLASLSVLSVPATYGESFGLYVLEALACGVPVVQPRHGAFPELIEATGGGRLCEPDDPASLADGLRELLHNEAERAALGEQGRRRVAEHFTSDRMALAFEKVCMMAAPCRTSSS